MQIEHLVDPSAAAIVLGGTMLAAIARSGLGAMRLMFGHLLAVARPRFAPARMRAELAGMVVEMQNDGVIRTAAPPLADRELHACVNALIRHRSIDAMSQEYQQRRNARLKAQRSAELVLNQTGDLAPIFGLAGTLFALNQIPGNLAAQGQLGGAVSTAVVSTLYGLVSANLLFYPLASLIERQAAQEDSDRDAIMTWLAAQLQTACPHYARRAA